MDRTDIESRIDALSVWQRGSERAPHKPLLLLWALGRCAAGEERLAQYSVVDDALKPLLEEFGPPRTTHHTEYPFWYLQNDGLWEVKGADEAQVREGKASQPTKGELLRVDARGGLTRETFAVVRSDPKLLHTLASRLVDAHFPDTVRGDVLQAVGIHELEVVRRRKRDPAFRSEVLTAYGYRCCVCDFDARLGTAPIGIEAAHIKWYQAGGPDGVMNGLGLCSLHHTLFDRGAFTVEGDHEIVVSELANGGDATELVLLRFHGEALKLPRSAASRPDFEYLEWHREQVFKG